MYLKTAFPYCTTDAAHGMPSAQQRKLPQVSLLALVEFFFFSERRKPKCGNVVRARNVSGIHQDDARRAI
jgi:hypothetical protein